MFLLTNPLNVSHLSGRSTGSQITENKAQNMSLLAAERHRPVSLGPSHLKTASPLLTLHLDSFPLSVSPSSSPLPASARRSPSRSLILCMFFESLPNLQASHYTEFAHTVINSHHRLAHMFMWLVSHSKFIAIVIPEVCESFSPLRLTHLPSSLPKT